ncbi:hypothetical protein NC652_040929 [Populus alba x Populus x berolinensis]|nr:hypothetical protein NC652_040929 [Populus alba x Populus x berolinensis]
MFARNCLRKVKVQICPALHVFRVEEGPPSLSEGNDWGGGGWLSLPTSVYSVFAGWPKLLSGKKLSAVNALSRRSVWYRAAGVDLVSRMSSNLLNLQTVTLLVFLEEENNINVFNEARCSEHGNDGQPFQKIYVLKQSEHLSKRHQWNAI